MAMVAIAVKMVGIVLERAARRVQPVLQEPLHHGHILALLRQRQGQRRSNAHGPARGRRLRCMRFDLPS